MNILLVERIHEGSEYVDDPIASFTTKGRVFRYVEKAPIAYLRAYPNGKKYKHTCAGFYKLLNEGGVQAHDENGKVLFAAFDVPLNPRGGLT